jgi:peptide deformylase
MAVMALLEILHYPNPLLKRKSVPVDKVDSRLQKLAEDMLETMYAAPGIGLAAPQVGELVRLLVIDTRPTDDNDQVDESRMTELEKAVQYPVIIFNPEIVKSEGVTTYEEGCLSVPGYTEEVQRAKWIEAHGLDKDGKKLIIQTDGLLAICLQHEMDHLEGKLFIDRISFVKSERIKSKIKKYGYPDNDPDDENRSAL